MKTLAIAPDIAFPIDVVTQKLSFLGRTSSGKTYAAQKLAELMLEANAQIVVLDPVGPWHGLRVAGKGPGFDIPVFGGLKGDLPLEPGAGALVADIICNRSISAVLDTSQMTHGEQLRFANDFGTRLFQRKKAEPGAVHLFLEECQEFVPQNPGHGLAPMCLSTYERIVKLGRNFGIGCSLISQRPQEVNKKALNQTECLFAFQMTGPQERKTMVAWMGELSDKSTAVDITDSLPKLLDNHCIVWSPSWLRIKLTTRVNEKRTADVSSTPKVGAKSKVAQALTPIDLEALRETMASTIEESRANDPAELKKEIAALKKQLVNRDVKPEKVVERVEVRVPFVPDRLNVAAKNAIDGAKQALEWCEFVMAEIVRETAAAKTSEAKNGVSSGRSDAVSSTPSSPRTSRRAEAPKSAAPPRGQNGLGRMPRALLTALAQHPEGLNRKRLHIFAEYRPSGDTSTQLAAWLDEGAIVDIEGALRITPAGLQLLGDWEPLPTGSELRQRLIAKEGALGSALLKVLFDIYPDDVSRKELHESAGYKPSGDSSTLLAKHINMGHLLKTSKGLRASEELFS